MDTDFIPGDPSRVLLGKPDEQSAIYHGPQPPKPGPTGSSILADIKLRRQQLAPLNAEYNKLLWAMERLKGI